MSILGPPIGYVDMLDASLVAKSKGEAEKPFDKMPLRPSAAGTCSRRLALELNDFKNGIRTQAEVKDPNVMRLLDLGNSVEWHMIKLFKQMNLEEVRAVFPQ